MFTQLDPGSAISRVYSLDYKHFFTQFETSEPIVQVSFVYEHLIVDYLIPICRIVFFSALNNIYLLIPFRRIAVDYQSFCE